MEMAVIIMPQGNKRNHLAYRIIRLVSVVLFMAREVGRMLFSLCGVYVRLIRGLGGLRKDKTLASYVMDFKICTCLCCARLYKKKSDNL